MASQVQTSTVLDHVRRWAKTKGGECALSFLRDGEELASQLSFAELDHEARVLAGKLQSWNMPGERALLLFPSSREFVTAFFGCMYAGVIPVAAYPPRGRRPLSRLQAIADDADVRIVLTTSEDLDRTRQTVKWLPGLERCKWLTVDNIEHMWADNWSEPTLDARSLAFLQYTSGSTAKPKGVMVSHRNLAENVDAMARAWGTSADTVAVCWLPLFHDLGLIGNVIQAIYVGFHCVLMSPESFIRKPSRWLQAISDYSATFSGGPNFAFDLCTRRISSEEKSSLNLSQWSVCYNGSESVRPRTIERFSSALAECGFRVDAFCSGYGLAEATLLVTSRPIDRPSVCLRVNSDEIEQGVAAQCRVDGHSREYMSCGVADASFDLRIVDPVSKTVLPEDRIGEVWINGPSVAAGYWRNPEATVASFGHSLSMTRGSFLRTGDLGFLHNSELFITGRLKDLIIIRGRNHFPEDIETTVEQSHDAFRPGCGAAFSIDANGDERLIIIYEIRRAWHDANLDEVSRTAKKAVSEEHGVAAGLVLLVKQGDISKTTSGKIARSECKKRFLQNDFRILHPKLMSTASNGNPEQALSEAESNEETSFIEDMASYLADCLGVTANQIPRDCPLLSLGLDSLQIENLFSHLHAEYGLQIPSTVIVGGYSLQDIAVQLLPRPDGTRRNALDAKSSHSFTVWFESRRRHHEKFEIFGAQHGTCYFRPFSNSDGVTATFNGRRLIMLGSNNYLGLTADHRVREAAANAAYLYGPSMTGSRLLNGTTDLHRQLEQELAQFVGRDDALVFTTGYQAIVGMISGIMNHETALILDEKSHACAIDGARIARCRVNFFKHNEPDDLRRKLSDNGVRPTLVLVDGVYSVEGDYSCLPEIQELCRKFGAWLAVDDSHGLGVVGDTGRGIEEYFGMRGTADLLAGTFSKSLASIGGWVAGNANTIDWIRFHGRTMLFSAAMPPPAVAAALKSLEILRNEPDLVHRARQNGRFWRNGLKELGARVNDSETPIVPIWVGDAKTCLNLASDLFDAGVYVNPFIHPAVHQGEAVLRSSVTARHTEELLSEALRVFSESERRHGVFTS